MATTTTTSVNNPLDATTVSSGQISALNATDAANTSASTATGLINSATTPTATVRDVTENETVSGQLNKLIDGNSTYMQSARQSGLDTANSRGLLNSSIAAQSSQKAAIDAAAPIAAQDASTYAASGLSAQNANQTNAANKYSAELQAANNAQSLYNSATLQEQQGQISSALKDQDFEADKFLKQMDINVDLAQLASADRQSFVTAVTPLMQQYQTSYTNIQSQPKSVMSATAKAAALADLEEMYKPQLESMANIYGYSLEWGDSDASATDSYNASVERRLSSLESKSNRSSRFIR